MISHDNVPDWLLHADVMLPEDSEYPARLDRDEPVSCDEAASSVEKTSWRLVAERSSCDETIAF
jgi:hypothetical protein